ncbi:BCCT family transporter [Halomonas halodenitrificans]|uniref:BCCT family transporter n=1 Tax=Halomonas halodenitrificans TaxID=28252 RepID=UPI000686B957|nr:BCCT family transporter [Halomonas halodenitrificans]
MQSLKRMSLFIISSTIIALLLAFVGLRGETAADLFSRLQGTLASSTGWLLIFIMNAVLLFALYLLFTPLARIRLGGPDARPEFSRLDWFGMLFAAGMGIGLLFYSVSEPLQHFASFRPYLDTDAEAAQISMEMTFLHWGLHPWGVYALVGLTLAFFHYNAGHRLSFEAPLRELMSPARARRLGWFANLAAVIGTIFGITTSLGLGASQASAGIAELSGLDADLRLNLIVIGGVCALALVSVLSGLGNGVRLLSKLNLLIAAGLMLFVLFAGEPLFIFKALGEHLGTYINDLSKLSTWNETYTGTNWQSKWTIFYWSWWISWSPFVGMFIAQVSKGRTIREYLLGVLLVPTSFNFLWMTVFGSNALFLELFADAGFAEIVATAPDASLYRLLDYLPLSTLTMGVAVLVVLVFFVTSADSGALVVATLTSNGEEPSWRQRFFWVACVGLVTAFLLRAGGLGALQSAAVASGLPFGLLLLAFIPALSIALRQPYTHPETTHQTTDLPESR